MKTKLELKEDAEKNAIISLLGKEESQKYFDFPEMIIAKRLIKYCNALEKIALKQKEKRIKQAEQEEKAILLRIKVIRVLTKELWG